MISCKLGHVTCRYPGERRPHSPPRGQHTQQTIGVGVRAGGRLRAGPRLQLCGPFLGLLAFLELTSTDPFAARFLLTGDATPDGIRVVRSVLGAISSLPIVAFQAVLRDQMELRRGASASCSRSAQSRLSYGCRGYLTGVYTILGIKPRLNIALMAPPTRNVFAVGGIEASAPMF